MSMVLAMERSPESLVTPGEDLVSPWLSMFQPIALGGLRPAEVSAYLARVGESLSLGVKELRWIDRVAGGHPYLLQSALSVLYPMQSARAPFDPGVASRELWERVGPYVERLWSESTDAERAILVAISLQSAAALVRVAIDPNLMKEYPHPIQKELVDMSLRGLVSAQGGRGAQVTSILLEWRVLDWLRGAGEQAVSNVLLPGKVVRSPFPSRPAEDFNPVEDAAAAVRALEPGALSLEEWARYRVESDEE